MQRHANTVYYLKILVEFRQDAKIEKYKKNVRIYTIYSCNIVHVYTKSSFFLLLFVFIFVFYVVFFFQADQAIVLLVRIVCLTWQPAVRWSNSA